MATFPRIEIDPDIARAETLPAFCYRDPAFHERVVERVFAPSWQYVGALDSVAAPRSAHPFVLLPGCLDEPLVLTRDDEGELCCLVNVCTHRGHLVVRRSGPCNALRCGYHGRRFGLDGAFVSMPEFDGVQGFPSARDDLPRLPLATWRQFAFTSLDPRRSPDGLLADLAPVAERTGFLPWERARRDRARSRDYEVAANWMLYVDNYLEGLHIPFVHPALARAVDCRDYRTECFEAMNLQIALASGTARADGAERGGATFALPDGHPDAGLAVAAWYFWCFPNLMLNVYPWGCSLNLVQPLAHDRTRVSFEAWVWDGKLLGAGAGAALDRVEREDEMVVEATQLGVRSRHYERGRYSALRERCVHHFHRLLAAAVQ